MFSIPSTFNRHTARQPFSAIPSAGVKYCPPALFTSKSSLPARSDRCLDQPPCVRRLAHIARNPVH